MNTETSTTCLALVIAWSRWGARAAWFGVSVFLYTALFQLVLAFPLMMMKGSRDLEMVQAAIAVLGYSPATFFTMINPSSVATAGGASADTGLLVFNSLYFMVLAIPLRVLFVGERHSVMRIAISPPSFGKRVRAVFYSLTLVLLSGWVFSLLSGIGTLAFSAIGDRPSTLGVLRWGVVDRDLINETFRWVDFRLTRLVCELAFALSVSWGLLKRVNARQRGRPKAERGAAPSAADASVGDR
jgi:hypothetical protein